jgi:tRNA pseudouridine55 synthase
LAEGVLLVLAGEAVHRKEEFLNMKKEYEVEVLFGFETDTFDVMGIPLSSLRMRGSMDSRLHGNDNAGRINSENTLKKFIGKNIFEYPAYSSKTVSGKPLFSLARSGELEDVEIPKREMEISDLKVLGWREINSKELLKEIEEKISKVKGDFRQDIILSKWREVLEKNDANFQVAKIRAEVSSGTYMRTLAHEWGKKLGVPALAFHIIRTKVGGFMLE